MSIAYTRFEAKWLADDIRRAFPHLIVEEHRDFGFAVDVLDPEKTRMVVACQPERPELSQPGILRDLDFIREAFKC